MSKKQCKLFVRTSYEENRLAKFHISDAYEILVPVTKRQIDFVNKNKKDIKCFMNRGGNK